MSLNYYQHIDAALRRFPAQEVLVWPAETAVKPGGTTAGELLDLVAAAGKNLRENGIEKGQPVLLLLPVGLELIGNLLAVMAIGAVPVLPPAGISKTGLGQLLREASIAALVMKTRPGLAAALVLKWLGVKPIHTAGIKTVGQPWLKPEPVNPDQAALVSHSSGSTGKAKAIYRSHRVLQAQHAILKQVFPPKAGLVDFPLFPNILLHNLAIGVKSVLPAIPDFDLGKLDPARIVHQLEKEKVNTLTGNVYYFRKLLEYLNQDKKTFPLVSALGIGGSPVPERLARALSKYFPVAAIFLIYGSSEAEPIAVRKLDGHVSDPLYGYEAGLVVRGLACKIVACGKLLLPDGQEYETGEILVKGSHAATSPGEWLRTGDYGYLRNGRQLFLTGRQGNEKMHQGIQHYQIEHLLQHTYGLNRVAARSLPDGFVLYLEGKTAEKQIRETLAAHFPGLIMKDIRFREKLPVDARHHSKIQYTTLH